MIQQQKTLSLTQAAAVKTTATVLFVAVAVVLSSIFHVTNAPGAMFLPMHLPILLCAFICGAKYAGPAGFATPFLVSLIPVSGRPMGMPSPFPVAITMAFELAAYGAVTGFVYWLLFRNRTVDSFQLSENQQAQTANRKLQTLWDVIRIVAALAAGMAAGRLVYGLTGAMFYNIADGFGWSAARWLRAVLVTGLPGIAIQLAVIPAAVLGVNRVKNRSQSDT